MVVQKGLGYVVRTGECILLPLVVPKGLVCLCHVGGMLEECCHDHILNNIFAFSEVDSVLVDAARFYGYSLWFRTCHYALVEVYFYVPCNDQHVTQCERSYTMFIAEVLRKIYHVYKIM